MTRLDEIKSRCEKATPGPWNADEDGMGRVWGEMTDSGVIYIASCKHVPRVGGEADGLPYSGVPAKRYDSGCEDVSQPRDDAAFIASAREDVPWLVSEVERLRGLAVMLRKGCEDGYGHAWRRQHALACGTCQMIRENFEENGDVR